MVCNACGSASQHIANRKARFHGFLNGKPVDFVDDVLAITCIDCGNLIYGEIKNE